MLEERNYNNEAATSVQDMSKNFDENTLSFKDNFIAGMRNYIGLTIIFWSTLLIFPVLCFQLDFYLPSHLQYAYISLIFNASDTLSRYVYMPYPITNRSLIDVLTGVKIFMIYLIYVSVKAESGLLTYHIPRLLMMFVFAFLNGYLCMGYIGLATRKFESIYDRNRTGYLISTAIHVGLSLGAVSSTFW